jgi:uncharacterized protein YhaN
MPVRIEEINAKGLGPIPEFTMKLGLINLIYGQNEQGKTYLVEFLIKSLFKKDCFTNLRSVNGQGIVQVSGIDPNVLSFSPHLRRKKLEDCIHLGEGSLPPSLGRLLVVRGGELAIAESTPGGVNQAILKEYLSSEGFLDSIQGHISKTIQKAQLSPNGEVIGSSTGEIKSRDEFRSQLINVDRLFERLQEVYSSGHRAILSQELQSVQAELDRMEDARRYSACTLNLEIQQLESEKSKIPQADLDALHQTIHDYQIKSDELRQNEVKLREKEAACANYPWLVEAIENYKNYLMQPARHPSRGFLLLGIVGLIAVIFFGALGWMVGILAGVALAGVFGWLYIRKLESQNLEVGNSIEAKQIEEEFSARFAKKFSGLIEMEVIRKQLDPEAIAAGLIREEIAKEIPSQEALQRTILDNFKRLYGLGVEEAQWIKTLEILKLQVQEFDNDINRLQRQYDKLNISPSDYLMDDPGVVFSEIEKTRLQNEVSRLGNEIQKETDALNNLKQEVATCTGADFSADWEYLIGQLRKKREDLASNYRNLVARMIAGVVVMTELGELREQEVKRINEGLSSKFVTQPLARFTRHYNHIELVGEELQVSDAVSIFPLSELSTGAQEQVLLALRTGFACKLIGQDALFLILDDAFQHTDWPRREGLVDEMGSLARQGWQILYLTMDDHIRSLFETRIKPGFGDQYHYYEFAP